MWTKANSLETGDYKKRFSPEHANGTGYAVIFILVSEDSVDLLTLWL